MRCVIRFTNRHPTNIGPAGLIGHVKLLLARKTRQQIELNTCIVNEEVCKARKFVPSYKYWSYVELMLAVYDIGVTPSS